VWLRKVITLTHQWYRDNGDFLGNWMLALNQLQRLLKSIIVASTVSSWMWHAVQLKHTLIRMLWAFWLTSRPYCCPLLMVKKQTVSLWIGLSFISKMTSTEQSYDANLTCCQIWWRPIQNITPWQDALQCQGLANTRVDVHDGRENLSHELSVHRPGPAAIRACPFRRWHTDEDRHDIRSHKAAIVLWHSGDNWRYLVSCRWSGLKRPLNLMTWLVIWPVMLHLGVRCREKNTRCWSLSSTYENGRSQPTSLTGSGKPQRHQIHHRITCRTSFIWIICYFQRWQSDNENNFFWSAVQLRHTLWDAGRFTEHRQWLCLCVGLSVSEWVVS